MENNSSEKFALSPGFYQKLRFKEVQLILALIVVFLTGACHLLNQILLVHAIS